jgi:hypothetical protein
MPGGGTMTAASSPRFIDSHGITADPGPHVVRADRPPRLIFVGVTNRQLE